MEYFDHFISNTVAAAGNQFFFSTEGKTACGRVLFRIEAGGKFPYSLLFSNILDSTFSTGEASHCNEILDSWELLRIRAARMSEFDMEPFHKKKIGKLPPLSFHLSFQRLSASSLLSDPG